MKHISPDASFLAGSVVQITIKLISPDGSIEATGIAHLDANRPILWNDLQSRVQFTSASLLDMAASTLTESELDTLVRSTVK